MRRVQRMSIDKPIQDYLDRRQSNVNKKLDSGNLDVNSEWKSARQTKMMGRVLTTLQAMMGTRQRCMYCLDSHGCDIEHFRPKSSYPKKMFRWNNLLLCCTECGRLKGVKFPMSNNNPLLIDPTKEEPWDYMDFDPITGNITARFDLQANDFFTKGQSTVSTLQLDRREALAAGYLHTHKKLCSTINNFLKAPNKTAKMLVVELLQEDVHGLLGWGFKGIGQSEMPFSQLKNLHPEIWQACCSALKYK